MDIIGRIKLLSLAFLLLAASHSFYVAVGDDENMMTSDQRQTEAAAESKFPIIDAAQRLLSLPTDTDSWILKVKALFRRGWHYFSPPNLDFRGGSGRGEGMAGKEGATVKVKEAAVKSLDESKATVEDSAKSAAKFAEDAVDKTVKKLKKTLSSKGQQKDHEAAEL